MSKVSYEFVCVLVCLLGGWWGGGGLFVTVQGDGDRDGVVLNGSSVAGYALNVSGRSCICKGGF